MNKRTLILMLAICVFLFSGCAKAKAYKQAIEANENGNYEKVIELLEDIGDYKDSRTILGNAKEYRYNNLLFKFHATTLSGGAKAETVGNMIKRIWSDTIFEKYNADTSIYTRSEDEKYHDDFNYSLSLYFASDEYQEAEEFIKSNLATVDKLFLGLNNPPGTCVQGHEIAKSLYEEYERLVNIAIHPSGSLTTYAEEFSDADTSYMNYYRKLERYFETIDFKG